MRKFVGALALTVSACSYHSPTEPAASSTTAPNEPFSLTLGSSVGSGTTADHATITAKVQGPTGQPLAGIVVTFSTTVGVLDPEQAATNGNGISSTTLVASTAATVTAKAGTLSARTGVGTQSAAQPPPTPTPTPAPGPNPGPTPTPPLSVTLTAADVIVGSTTILNANIKDGVPPYQVTWTFGDGTSFTGSSTSSAHLYAAAGSYPASINVTDAAGRTTGASTTVNVLASPPPPPTTGPTGPSYTVTLSASPSTVVINTPTTLTATVNQQNSAPAPTGYDWDCNGDGTIDFHTNAPTNTQNCTYATTGSFTAKVTATGGSVSGSGTTTVTVTPPPVPAITVSCNKTAALTASCAVSATLNGSPVPSANITHVAWDWGDGNATVTNAPNANISNHVYGAALTYTVNVSGVVVTGTTATGSGSGTANVQ